MTELNDICRQTGDVKKKALYSRLLNCTNALRTKQLTYSSSGLTTVEICDSEKGGGHSLSEYHFGWHISNNQDIRGNAELRSCLQRAVNCTEKIAIVDRYMTLSLIDQAWEEDSDSEKKIKPFLDTLEWVNTELRVDRSLGSNDPRIFIIATFPPYSRDSNHLQRFLVNLETKIDYFGTDITFPIGIVFPMKINASSEYLYLHERFICTEKVIVKSDGGFGLADNSESTLLIWNSQRAAKLFSHLESLNSGFQGKHALKMAVFSPSEKKWRLENNLPDSFMDLVSTAKNRGVRTSR